MRILAHITGGRPMQRIDFAFRDKVSNKSVYHYRDRYGRGWCAEGSWSLFRTRSPGYDA